MQRTAGQADKGAVDVAFVVPAFCLNKEKESALKSKLIINYDAASWLTSV